MCKKIGVSMLAILFILGFITVSFAADNGPGGNKRKGKYTYRKVYTACFERSESEVSEAKPPINPSDKTMAQWKQVFETKDFSEFKCAPEWDALSDEDLLDIYSYLYGYAADSSSPATCK